MAAALAFQQVLKSSKQLFIPQRQFYMLTFSVHSSFRTSAVLDGTGHFGKGQEREPEPEEGGEDIHRKESQDTGQDGPRGEFHSRLRKE